MEKESFIHRTYWILFGSAIVCTGLSVSLSQGLLILAFLAFLVDKGYKNLQFNSILIASILLFGWYLVSVAGHLVSSGWEASVWREAFQDECKDIFLFSGFLAAWGIKNEKDQRRIEKAFAILIFVLVLSGFISIFSHVRLSRLISDLYKVSHYWKFTHETGSIAGIKLYLPIGLMNTHLTFGGLLSFFFPYSSLKLLFSIRDKKWKAALGNLVFWIFFFLVFLLNNARSAMLGTVASIFIALIHLTFFRREFSLKIVSSLAVSGIAILTVVSILFLQVPALRKTIVPLLGEQKHTDSGRTFIWNSTFPLIQKHPLLGVGAGMYEKSVIQERKELSAEDPNLLYFYEVTQRGHAHNDFLHIAAFAGLPALFFFFLLIGAISQKIFASKIPTEKMFLFYGILGFFFSGLLQCYFQDDEVVIVFWILTGVFTRWNELSSKYPEAENKLA